MTRFPAGLSLFNLSLSYGQAGDFARSIENAREALGIFHAALPLSHPHVAAAQQWVLGLEAAIQKRS